MKTPLISVVLPVYNVAPYIGEAIDSILNQTVQDFEIIIIDDCSTDGTMAIVESFKDSRIRIIKKPKNKGLIDSLNIGFSEAKGTYIARMDGDDINVPNRFEKQLKILQNNPDIKACGCWLQCFGANKEVIKHKEFHNEIQSRLILSNSMSLGATMLNKNAYKNFKFDEDKVHVEDYDFWARTAWECNMHNFQEVLYLYRTHEKQVSTQYKNIQLQGDIRIKLFLFKKLNYNTNIYTDELIKKMILLHEPIQVNEFVLFINWLKRIIFLNRKTQVYSCQEFENVLLQLRRLIIFTFYFKPTDIGVDKKWRFQALSKLPLEDVFFVFKLKCREMKKTFLKNV